MAESDLLNEFGTFPIIKNGSDITITIGTPAIATVTDYDDNHLTNYWRERLGINIEVQLFDTNEYKTQLQLMTSSGERLPDILVNFALTPIERESYGSQGYFLDLLPYFEEHELTRYFDSEAASYLTEAEKATTISAGLSSNGALYAFPFWAVSVADSVVQWPFDQQHLLRGAGHGNPHHAGGILQLPGGREGKRSQRQRHRDEIPLVGFANSGNGDVIINLLNAFTYYPNT